MKKKILYNSAMLLIFTTFQAVAGHFLNPTQLTKVAHAITSDHCSHIPTQIKQLAFNLKTYENLEAFTPPQQKVIISALASIPGYMLTEHANTIMQCLEYFPDTPGFIPTLMRVVCYKDHHSMVQGHIYELEKAIEIKKRASIS